MYHLIVSDYCRTWILATPEASQVHCRTLVEGEGDEEGGGGEVKLWAIGILTNSLYFL